MIILIFIPKKIQKADVGLSSLKLDLVNLVIHA